MKIKIKTKKTRELSSTHKHYVALNQFRLQWEEEGGTRGTLRSARKAQRTLYPTQ